MIDHIGNTIREGDLLLWSQLSMPVKVLEVSDGGLSIADSKERTQPFIKIEVTLLLPASPRPTLQGFFRLVDPDSEKLLGAVQESVQ